MVCRAIYIVYESIVFDVRKFDLVSVMMITKSPLKSVHAVFGNIANLSYNSVWPRV